VSADQVIVRTQVLILNSSEMISITEIQILLVYDHPLYECSLKPTLSNSHVTDFTEKYCIPQTSKKKKNRV
jgi:hypothetical protein